MPPTWDEACAKLRQAYSDAPPSILDRLLPAEIVRKILLLAAADPPLDVVLADPVDPTRPQKWVAPFQRTTIMSALKRQEARNNYRLVSSHWWDILGLSAELAVRNVTKALALSKAMEERPEIAMVVRTLVLSVRDTSKGRLTTCERGAVFADVVARCTQLEELHVGGPLLGQTDMGKASRVLGGSTRLDVILAAAARQPRLRTLSVPNDRNPHWEQIDFDSLTTCVFCILSYSRAGLCLTPFLTSTAP